jgi:hypothetical protein
MVTVSVFFSSSAYSWNTRGPIADDAFRLVAAEAGLRLRTRRHVAPGGTGLGNGTGDDVRELPVPASFAWTNPGPFADVAVDAGDARVRSRSARRELRLHRRVARLPAELRRFHPVQAAVAGEQQDDDVDGGQRRRWQRAAAHAGRRKSKTGHPAAASGSRAAAAAATSRAG